MQYIPPAAANASTHNTQVQALSPTPDELSKNNVGDAFKAVLLRQYIQRIIQKNESQGITTDVSIVDLQTNQSIVSHNLDTEQFAASVNKIPIAELVLNDLRSGKMQFNQVLQWAPSDVREGAGVYDQPGAPTQATIRDLLFDLLNPSGNTAVRALVNQGLGGAAVVNTRFANELHLQHTALQILDGSRFYVGNTTAREAMAGMRQLLQGNDQYQQFVKHALATNIYTDYGVRTQLAGNDFIVLSNKVGILDDPDGDNRHDVGIIYNTKTSKAYGYAFLNTAYGESYNLPTAQAGLSLADMGKGVLRYAGDTRPNGQSDAVTQQLKQSLEGKRVRY
jgi:beta-lactamase class A